MKIIVSNEESNSEESNSEESNNDSSGDSSYDSNQDNDDSSEDSSVSSYYSSDDSDFEEFTNIKNKKDIKKIINKRMIQKINKNMISSNWLHSSAKPKELKSNDYRLCQIISFDYKSPFSIKKAIFTTQNVAKQMGKYWNKIPYTHARKANEWKYNKKHVWNLLEICFEAPFEAPAELFEDPNLCPYSIYDINNGDVSWLRPIPKLTSYSAKPIYAGITLHKFKKIIEKENGKIYSLE